MKRAARIVSAVYGRRRLWSLTAGVVYSLAFFDGRLFVFGFLGLFLFYARLFVRTKDGVRPEKPFGSAFFFGAGFFVPLYSWLTALYPFDTFGFTMAQGIFVVAAGILGISALHSLMLALSYSLLRFAPRNTLLLPVLAASCHMAAEWLMAQGSLAFPWGIAAVGQYRFLPLLQNVSLFGSEFITLVMCVFASSCALLLHEKSRKLIITAAVSLALPLFVGTTLMLIPVQTENAVRVAAVQGNELFDEKWDLQKHLQYQKYIRLTEQAASEGAELIVLPETAFPYNYTSTINKKITAVTAEYGCTVVVGAIEKKAGKVYNALFAVYPDGTRSESYYKRRIVPFGEYLPYRDVLMKLLPFLESMNLSSLDLTPGESDVVLEYPGSSGIGCFICFDSAFPSLAPDDAGILCVSTNDSWFKDTAAVYQHMAHSVLRAVENGKWVVRSANTGVSCFISPKGNISQATEPLTEALIYETVYTVSSRTLYSYTGDIIMFVPLGFLGYILIRAAAEKIKNKKKVSASS